MSRSSYKFFWQPLELTRWINKNKQKKKTLNFYKKNIVITPKLVGFFVNVYNGHKWVKIRIEENMVGFKLGEFILTRKKAVWKN
jgi:ribosomal protein S19